MDRNVLLLLRPWCAAFEFEPTVFDRLTCPLFERRVLDRLTSPLFAPLWFELTVFDRLTPFSSCVESKVPPLACPVGCSNENAVLLRLCPGSFELAADGSRECDSCDICDRCDRCDCALFILECRIGFRPVLRSRRLVQQQPIPAWSMKAKKVHPVAIHMKTNMRVPT